MYMQVIQGAIADPDHLWRQLEQWRADLKPGARGYLGSTGGITPDGRAITCVRFESEEAARVNGARPEQTAWWTETAKAFGGDVTFHDCPEVELINGGGSDAAGFVQVIQGRTTDRERLQELTAKMEEELREQRPDVLGLVVGWHADTPGTFTQIVYFTSEAEAREGEATMQESDMDAEFSSLLTGEPDFFDLPEPDYD